MTPRKKKKEMTEGDCFAGELMGYLDTMYPEIMKQSKGFRASLRHHTAQQLDSLLREVRKPVNRARTSIEIMIDKACGVTQ